MAGADKGRRAARIHQGMHLATSRSSGRQRYSRLCDRDESPWTDVLGKPLDGRGLALRLKDYGIKFKAVRISDAAFRGYTADDFFDAWERYLPPVTDVTKVTMLINKTKM